MLKGMTREQKLQILSTMDDGHLSKALGAAGVDVGDDGHYTDDMGEEEVNELVPWSQKSINVPMTTRPALIDKSKAFALDFTDEPTAPQKTPGAFDFVPAEADEEYHAQEGLFG